jgi:hypothetical protein
MYVLLVDPKKQKKKQVIRYLEHYHHLPGYQAFTGKISDASLNHIAFECAGLTYKTPLNPPMASFREARERLVQMDKECIQALDRSDITVKEFQPATGIHLAVFVLVSTTFLAFGSRSNFEQGSLVSAFLTRSFADFCCSIQPLVLYPMLAIHSAEAWHMSRGRLRRHSVNVRSRVWWLWMATTFIEGVGSFNRLVLSCRLFRVLKILIQMVTDSTA